MAFIPPFKERIFLDEADDVVCLETG